MLFDRFTRIQMTSDRVSRRLIISSHRGPQVCIISIRLSSYVGGEVKK